MNPQTRTTASGRRGRKAAAVLLATVSLAGAWSAAFGQASPVGDWRAIDGDTRQATSIVRITDGPDGLTGRIQTVLDPRLAAGAVCRSCEGDRRARPLVGLEVIRQVRPDRTEPGTWSGGDILDPENGKLYNVRLKPIDDGRRLEVRGYFATPLLGRTQTWVRVDENGRDVAAAAAVTTVAPPLAAAVPVQATPAGPVAPVPAAAMPPARVVPPPPDPSVPPDRPLAVVATAAPVAAPGITTSVTAPAIASPARSAQPTPLGLWTAIDADSHRETSLVRIVDGPDGLSGRIVKLLDRTSPVGELCARCDGERRGRPLVGLEIIRQARPDAGDPGVWSGGEVLDPENGKTYSLQLKPVDGGAKLEVRGYIGAPVLGRTQTWVRVE